MFVEGVETEICWRNMESGFFLFSDSSQILFQYSGFHRSLIKPLIPYIARGDVQNLVWYDIYQFLDLDFSNFGSLNMFSLSASSLEVLDRYVSHILYFNDYHKESTSRFEILTLNEEFFSKTLSALAGMSFEFQETTGGNLTNYFSII